ncbi:MAG: hypothetical protein MOGMAGMI_01682 [Candidatus Omnitrophica bacterium]|nr:hypothetical protein [Candidatus Omnitrophota bacterium]
MVRRCRLWIAGLLLPAFCLLSVGAPAAWALPAGWSVESGDVTFDTSDPSILTITASDRAVINFDSFSIGQGETVRFVQPIDSASVLGRVTGGSTSDIFGSLFANGQFVLVNPNGIHFGASADIQVGSLAASTLNISTADYLAGQMIFEKGAGSPTGFILNEANITAAPGGHIVLLSEGVANRGVLTAYLGTVALGAGTRATLSFDPGGLVNLVVDEGVADSSGEPLVTNSGEAAADGGKVLLTAKALNDTLDLLVNNTGVVRAQQVVERDGVIELVSNGSVHNTGSVIAHGGQASLLAEGNVRSTGVLDVGELIERGAAFTVGGVYRVPVSSIINKDGAINLATGDYSGTVSDSGDIIVDAAAVITLTADTHFQADDNNDGTGGFTMSAGSSIVGGGFNLQLTTGDASNLETIGGVANLTLSSSTGANTYTMTETIAVTGNVVTGSDADLSLGAMELRANGDIQLGASSDVAFTGNGALRADFDANGTGALTMNATATVDGGGNDVTLAAGAASTLYAITNVGQLSIAASTGTPAFTANSAYNVTTLALTGGAILDINGNALTATTLNNNGTLRLQGGETVTITTFDTDSGTVDYDGGGSYANLAAGDNYFNLTFSGSGDWTQDAALDVNGNLTVSAGTLVSSGNNITLAGHWNTTGGNYTSGANTVIFDGTSNVTSAGESFNNVQVGTATASGSVTLQDATDINGTLSFNTTGGTAAIDLNSQTVNYAGGTLNLTNADTFTSTGSTVIFDGTTTLTSAGKSLNNVTIGTATASGSLTLADAADLNGSLTFNTTGGTAAMDLGSQTVNFAGSAMNLTNADTFTSTGSTVIFDGTTTLTSAGQSLNNVTIGTATASGSLTLADAADLNGDLTFNTTGGTAAMDLGGQTVNFAGSAMNLTNADTFTSTGSTVIFDGTTTLTSAGKSLNNVTIGTATASGSLTLADAADLNGSLTFNTTGGTAAMDLGGQTVNFAGSAMNLTNADTFTSTGSTVIFDGTTTLTSATRSFNNVQIGTATASGSLTLADGADINGTLSFNTTGGTTTLDLGSQTLNYSAATLNLTNLDTFTSSGSTVIFDGTTALTSATKAFHHVQVGSNSASGSVTLQDAADLNGSLTFNTTGGTAALDLNSQTLTISGSTMDLTNADTFTATGSTVIIDGNVTLTSAGESFNNITVGTATASGNLTLADDADINGTLAFNTTGGTAVLNISSRTVNYAGPALDLTNADTFTVTGSTVIFDGTTTLTSAGKGFNNVQIGTATASGSLTLADTADINGTLSFNTTGGTTTLDITNRTVNYAGASLDMTALDTFTSTGSTWVLDGTTDQVLTTGATKSFNNFTVNNTGGAADDDISFVSSLDVNGIFTLTDGDFTAPGAAMSFTVGDDFLMTGGTFNHNSGTVTLDTTTAATLNISGAGAGSITFNNLTSITAGKTLQFGAGDTFTVDGTLTLTGASGNNIVLSSTSAGQRWFVDPAATDITFVTVSDSSNTSGTTIDPAGSTNGGNTSGWFTVDTNTPPPAGETQINITEVNRSQFEPAGDGSDLNAGDALEGSEPETLSDPSGQPLRRPTSRRAAPSGSSSGSASLNTSEYTGPVNQEGILPATGALTNAAGNIQLIG